MAGKGRAYALSSRGRSMERSPGYRRYVKRVRRRLVRRAAKLDPINAPTRNRHSLWGYPW